VLRGHTFAEPVARLACVALGQLARGGAAARLAVLDSGAPEALLAAASVHKAAELRLVVPLVCWAFVGLADAPAGRNLPAALEGVPGRLCYLLDLRRRDALAAALACQAMARLLSGERQTAEVADALIAAHAMTAAVAVLGDARGQDAGAALWACALLAQVMRSCSAPEALLAAKGELALLALLERRDVPVGLVCGALKAVALAAKRGRRFVDALLCAGAERIIREAISGVAEHAEVREVLDVTVEVRSALGI